MGNLYFSCVIVVNVGVLGVSRDCVCGKGRKGRSSPEQDAWHRSSMAALGFGTFIVYIFKIIYN